jgi:hypothetical protein
LSIGACGGKWHEPETGDGVAVSLEDWFVVLEDVAVGAIEEHLVAIVTELTHGEK